MRWKEALPALLVGLALSGLAFVPAAEKPASKAEAPSIDKLVEQLGSDTFAERQDASKALDALGAAALPALEKAAKSEDAEVRKRATELFARISLRTRSAAVLSPTMVHLKFKDVPVKEALADFEKQAKASFNLIDPENKLAGKKVTLDTGKVPFWVALEQFCAAAGLDEADPSRMPAVPAGVVPPPMPPLAFPFPGGAAVGGAAGRKLTDAEIKAMKEKLEEARKAAEKAREDALRRLKELKEKGGAAAPAPAVDVAVAVAEDKPLPGKPAVPAPPAIALPPVLAVPPIPPVAGGGIAFPGAVPGGMPFPGISGFQHGKINLVAGKAAKVPTDARTSVRVRVAPATAGGNAAPDKTFSVMLQAAPEPRLRWQQLTGITIDTAIDDNDQKLTKFEQPGPMNNGGGFGIGGGVIVFPGGRMAPGFGGFGMNAWSNDGVNHTFQLLLNKGEKASKKLKELSGTLSATFLSEAKPHIVADDVMKAAGKTFKGDKGGSITVNKVSAEKDGTVRIEFEFEQPTDVVPEQQVQGFNGGPVPPGGVRQPIRIRPGVRIRPAPLPAPVPPVPAPAPDAKKKEEAKKGAAKAEIKVEVAVPGAPAVGAPAIGFAVPGGPAIAMPAIAVWNGPMGFSNAGLTLQDDKGKVIGTQIQMDFRGGRIGGAIGAKPKFTWVAVYKAQKGQPAEPSKLVFTGRTSHEVTVPFKLENIDLK